MKIVEIPIKIDDLGWFSHIFGNTHMVRSAVIATLSLGGFGYNDWAILGHTTHDRFLTQLPVFHHTFMRKFALFWGIVHAGNPWTRSGTHGGFLNGWLAIERMQGSLFSHGMYMV